MRVVRPTSPALRHFSLAARSGSCRSAEKSSSRSPSLTPRMPRRFSRIWGCASRVSRAWSIPRGTTAQQAAGEIHSDLARGFIRAEVVAYETLAARGSMSACREHGEVRLEGKDYVVRDGDVITVRFAT